MRTRSTVDSALRASSTFLALCVGPFGSAAALEEASVPTGAVRTQGVPRGFAAAAAYLDERISEADYQSIVKSDAAEKIFEQEKQRRFELLQAHWDVNVKRGESFVPE